MRRGSIQNGLVVFLGISFSTAPALGCNLINSANGSLQDKLEVQKDIQRKLDEALNQETNRCQNEANRVSSHTAQVAGAQSCVALQESAAYNRELKDISHNCVDKLDGIKFAMEFVRTSTFTPFRSSIDLVVQSDQEDAFLQRICPAQLSDTSDLLDRTNELMNHSKRGIAQAQTDRDKFAALESQVFQFERTTQNGYDRCVAEGQILVNQPVAGMGSGAPPPAARMPAGTTPKDESTITGVEQEDAKRAREREILGF